MKYEKKFTQREQQEVSETQKSQAETKEFGSVEEILRHDAKQTVVPPAVTQRLDESIKNSPCRPRSWWRRLLG
jgi:hypothetical protein